MYLFSYFLKNLRESQLLKQKIPMGYGYISYFLSNQNTIFTSSHDLHYIFPPHPLVQKTLSMYIANKIAKDQYVQPNVPTTTILTMTPDHMYMKGSTGTLFIHP